MFLFHYGKHKQVGGNRTSKLPLNILNCGGIIHYSINFSQHKNVYDFLSSNIIDAFLDFVYEVYRPLKGHKFQGYVEIITQQKGEVILEDKQVLLTNSFTSKHFDDIVGG